MKTKAPRFGAALAPAHPSEEAKELLRMRRSTAADFLSNPGPDKNTVNEILEIATRVPDHRRVVPFRFILFEGEARARAGDILADIYARENDGVDAARLEKERMRFNRAPIVVAVISNVDQDHRTPDWEQLMTVGAVCQNMLIAASAHGFAAQWLTEWYAYDEHVCAAFGLNKQERVAGYIYIGTARENPKERQRPVISDLVTRY